MPCVHLRTLFFHERHSYVQRLFIPNTEKERRSKIQIEQRLPNTCNQCPSISIDTSIHHTNRTKEVISERLQDIATESHPRKEIKNIKSKTIFGSTPLAPNKRKNNRSNKKEHKHDTTLPNLVTPRKFDDEKDYTELSFGELLHGDTDSILSHAKNVLFVERMDNNSKSHSNLCYLQNQKLPIKTKDGRADPRTNGVQDS